ncbi:family 35 glycoside hydrolase [Cryphonectria parasitica EP155]|uniref:beta-galactosidase n=1 Tax=Cryphonectria parasitica (strain ATCC 38755 / EP155) TaxID=660469 RepID=A0A9P5CU84_CRYP1|nr:family 35 glycoside hydrolase [Cryphonectria parasitica EP155]KAF3769880.1 family 35 glycoside hydrolase [Cryphonectria parasitica EP155]
MRASFHFLTALLAWWVCGVSSTTDNLTSAVTWDEYSLLINGSRVFINSAEFHYPRLPNPALWPDIFQKFKAAGFNTVSLYFFWNYHSAARGVYDFTSPGKDLQALFDAASDAGLWVISRPGPYSNGEYTAGGLALWGSDGSMGTLRTSDEAYYEAWLPWVQELGAIIAANQITEGGPVILNQIENELQETTHSATNTLVVYMEQIEAAFREAGVVVPFTSNEKGMRSESWSVDYEDVGGAVNVYGLDSYPGGLSCTNPASGWTLVRTYYQWFQNYSYTQPSFLPEFEGGYFTAWGSGTFYDTCVSYHDPAYPDLFYKNNIAEKVTMQNFYMGYGGTNWGHSAAPVVYTSYDYAAHIRETRQLWPKVLQTKLINLFASSSPDLLKTDMIGNGTGYQVDTDDIFTWLLQNPDTGASFLFTQQTTSSSEVNVTFTATLNTSLGPVNVPNVSLFGHQSRILVTDYAIGNNHTLLYSSGDIATWATFDNDDNGGDDEATTTALVLYLKAGQTGEFAFANEAGLTYTAYGTSLVTTSNSSTAGQIFTYTQGDGPTFVKFSNGVLVYLLDQTSAWTFWAPPASTSAADNVYGSPDDKIFILGSYLVRNASLGGDGVLRISGDNNVTTTIETLSSSSSSSITSITWNDIPLNATRTSYGTYTATIPGTESRSVVLPEIATLDWHSADSLPESDPSFDDSSWIVCNKTTTQAYIAPYTLPVLFSSDYGYYAGAKIYRGYFPASSSSSSNYTSVNITASGGDAFGWSAWLNGVFIGGDTGNTSALETTTAVLALPPSALLLSSNGSSSSSSQQQENVLTVLVDYHGHDETSVAGGMNVPRGLYGAQLLPAPTTSTSTANTTTGFTTWKIQGSAGGSAANIDPVRGPFNEGGLYGERLGWHLPGFSPSTSYPTSYGAWDDATPLDGLTGPGVRFYVANFTLDIDDDLDAPLGLAFSAPEGTVARVLFWVNGYQYGKYEPHIGPQTVFPFPPGVVNNQGQNSLAVSLWAMEDGGAALDGLELVVYDVYQTAFGFARDWSALQPGWTDRSQYV